MTSVSDYKCCVPNCSTTRKDHITLHNFPNFEKDPDRFRSWLHAIGGKILGLDNETVYKKGRVCHRHFDTMYLTWSKSLSRNSIPTLVLPDLFKKVPNKTNPVVIMGGSKRPGTTDNKCDIPRTLIKLSNKNADNSNPVEDTSQEWLEEERGSWAGDSDNEIEQAFPEVTKKTSAWEERCAGCLQGGRQLTTMDSVEVVVRPGLPHLACRLATLYEEIIGACPPVASSDWSMCVECVNRLTAAYLFKRQCVESLEVLTVDTVHGAGGEQPRRSSKASDGNTAIPVDTNEEGCSQTSVGSRQTTKVEQIFIKNKGTSQMDVDNEVLCETEPHTEEAQCTPSEDPLQIETYQAVETEKVQLSMKSDHNEQATKVKKCQYCGQTVALSDTMQNTLCTMAISKFRGKRKCFVCSKVLTSFHALVGHMETHIPNACDKCMATVLETVKI